MNTFNPNRLKFARQRRCLSIKTLSEKIGITSRTLSDFENGRRTPQPITIKKISGELNFPEKFFFMVNISELKENTVSFRSLSRMSASVRVSAIRSGEIALEFSSWLDKKYELPSANLPDLRDYKPEVAAEVVRNEWAIGEQPIHNMVHLLEANGVRVFSLVQETMDMDAYSFWMNDCPYIFLNTVKSVERSRFDAAHELGHLVLHKHGGPTGKEAESHANHFASAFLMPQNSILSHAPSYPTLEVMIEIKSNWKVSVAALIRRMKDLDLITEWQYRSFNIELSKRGYLKNEPWPIEQREISKILPVLFKLLKDDGVTKNFIANELGTYVDDINALMFNLTLTGIEGGSRNTDAQKDIKNRRHLSLVK